LSLCLSVFVFLDVSHHRPGGPGVAVKFGDVLKLLKMVLDVFDPDLGKELVLTIPSVE